MANSKPVGVAFSDPDLKTGWGIEGVAVPATAAEINNNCDDMIASMTTATTPATGSCAVQLVFLDAAGNPITSKRSLIVYISDVNGAPVTAVTSFAALTNGSVDLLITGKQYRCLTSAAGLLGLTVTAAAATYYLSVVLQNGKILTSSAVVSN